MSFWEKLKPAPKTPVATGVKVETDPSALALDWDDGVSTRVPARLLRQRCPCAECVEEWSGRRTLDPKSVPAEVKVVEAASVGNYALALVFSDGHRTGIFTWPTLRSLSEERPS